MFRITHIIDIQNDVKYYICNEHKKYNLIIYVSLLIQFNSRFITLIMNVKNYIFSITKS